MDNPKPTTFNKDFEYYQQDWQDYYPTVIPLVPYNCSVLDVGCGRGGLAQYLRDSLNCRVTGLDISEDALTAYQKKGIETVKCNIEEDRVPGTYDVILCCAVLEHLVDPISVLRKLRDNIAQGGYLIALQQNFSHLTARFAYLRGRNITHFGDHTDKKRLGEQGYGHIRFFNKATLEYVLENTGFDVVQWAYHKPSLSIASEVPFYRRPAIWLIHSLYQINHELFSVTIAAKAKKT